MKLRISPKEEQYLDYLKKTSEQNDSHEYRGSWQQIIRHIVDQKMVHDINKDDNPFKFVPDKSETDKPFQSDKAKTQNTDTDEND